MNWAFFGTDEFASITLGELAKEGFIPSLIVCAPDAPMRRHRGFIPPQTKIWAQKNDIKTLQPEKLDSEFIESLKSENWDFFIVASYGKIIPQAVLDIPKNGVLNVHPSLLPKYRGASPVESAILDDNKNTGVTIMEMDHLMDHGPIVSQSGYRFEEWPSGPEARNILAHLGGEILAKTIPDWLLGDIKPEDQNHNEATYTRKLEKIDAELDLENGDGYENFRKFQAFKDWYNTYFWAHKNGSKIRVVIHEAQYSDNKFEIIKVVPEGKKEMDWKQFENFLKN